jgi:N-methylhydantoinase B
MELGSKEMLFDIPGGTWMELYCGGGGGYGSPYQRNIEKVYREVSNELLSIEKAEEEYGVIIDPVNLQVDYEKTEEIRRKKLPSQV